MSIRKQAQAKIKEWKKDLKKGHQIAKMTKLTEAVISRIYTGNGFVTEAQCQKVLDTK